MENKDANIEDSSNYILNIFRKSLSLVKIHRPQLLIVAIFLFIVSMMMFYWSIKLIVNWERTIGKVISIDPVYKTCEMNDKADIPCTEFTTVISFRTLSWEVIQFSNRLKETVHQEKAPISSSKRTINEKVNVIYLPEDPLEKSFEDTFMEIWLFPIVLMFGHIATFLWAFSKWKR